MGLWRSLRRGGKNEPPAKDTGEEKPREAEETPEPSATPLPVEPFVFECRVCHKVFEARRKHPPCPECGSDDVEEMD